jgi:hypothetical protein
VGSEIVVEGENTAQWFNRTLTGRNGNVPDHPLVLEVTFQCADRTTELLAQFDGNKVAGYVFERF